MTIGQTLSTANPQFLVVSEPASSCGMLLAVLHDLGLKGIRTLSAFRFIETASDCNADCIVFLVRPCDVDALLPAVECARSHHPFVHLLVVLDEYADGSACQAFRAGASAVAAREGISYELERFCQSAGATPQKSCLPAAKETAEMARWIGSSVSSRRLRSWLPRVAAIDCNVLITGETGSGKELIADLIHCASGRRNRRLVCINCAAVPETLIESELFGHERGSFTGAMTSREGSFEAANGGTIFLDEIGEMTPMAQAKILRVLETKQVQRLGSERAKQLDIRIVAATNQSLSSLVETGRFRKDLIYRLKVAEVHVPPLRERREDIALLLKHFLEFFNRKYHGHISGFSAAAMRRLLGYDWPGNVRELRNLVEFLFIASPRSRVQAEELPLPSSTEVASSDRQRLMETLASVQWNKSAAARILKWSRMTLYRKMAKYEIPDHQAAAAGHLA